MLGTKSGFEVSVKKRAPKVKGVYCKTHRQALASKTLVAALGKLLDQTIQIVNFVKGGVLSSRPSSSYVLTQMQVIICFFSVTMIDGFQEEM
jgi:hypothetical protein